MFESYSTVDKYSNVQLPRFVYKEHSSDIPGIRVLCVRRVRKERREEAQQRSKATTVPRLSLFKAMSASVPKVTGHRQENNSVIKVRVESRWTEAELS